MLFCLLGTVMLFRAGELAAPRRILLAGALFGLAGGDEGVGDLPGGRPRLRLRAALEIGSSARSCRGWCSGSAVPSLPFFVPRTGSFIHDVVVAQLTRSTSEQGFGSAGERLELMLGVGTPASAHANTHLAWGVGAPARRARRRGLRRHGAEVALRLVRARRDRARLRVHAVRRRGLLRLLLVLRGRVRRDAARRCAARDSPRLARGRRPRCICRAAACSSRRRDGRQRHATTHACSSARAYDPAATISRHPERRVRRLRPGRHRLIDSNRFFASRPGCPPLVDAFGLWLTDNDGVPPPARRRRRQFVATWRAWLERADYAVLAVPHSDYVPWTDDLTRGSTQLPPGRHRSRRSTSTGTSSRPSP